MIRNIVFDIGNVLVAFRYDDYMKDLGFDEETRKVMKDKIIENEIWARFDLGIQTEEELIQEMIQRVPGYEKEARQFFDRIVDIVETYPYTASWIKELKSRGYNVYLLSNYPKDMFRLHEEKKFNFTQLVDGKIVSGFVQMSKPDPNIYKLLLDTYSLKASECIFLDDKVENVEAAIELGMNGVVFTGYEEARATFDMFLR